MSSTFILTRSSPYRPALNIPLHCCNTTGADDSIEHYASYGIVLSAFLQARRPRHAIGKSCVLWETSKSYWALLWCMGCMPFTEGLDTQRLQEKSEYQFSVLLPRRFTVVRFTSRLSVSRCMASLYSQLGVLILCTGVPLIHKVLHQHILRYSHITTTSELSV